MENHVDNFLSVVLFTTFFVVFFTKFIDNDYD